MVDVYNNSNNKSNIILSTLMTYDVNKYKPVGIVRGINVHGVSLFRNIIGNLSSLFGGKNDAINKKVDDVYNDAIDELIKNAMIVYPGVTMISGVEVTLSETKNVIICVATGTALVSDTRSTPAASFLSSPQDSHNNIYSFQKKTKTRKQYKA
jgi:uncharacterized protein YbjQ (UPF0145 family)